MSSAAEIKADDQQPVCGTADEFKDFITAGLENDGAKIANLIKSGQCYLMKDGTVLDVLDETKLNEKIKLAHVVVKDPLFKPMTGYTVIVDSQRASEKRTFADDEYKAVDAADVFIGSRKYLGKPIQLKGMHCYYADVDDYRCVASDNTMLAVFTKKIEPASVRDLVEKNCDQLKTAMTTARCAFNVRIVYDSSDVNEDLVSGYQQRKVIRLDSVSLVQEERRGRRRR